MPIKELSKQKKYSREVSKRYAQRYGARVYSKVLFLKYSPYLLGIILAVLAVLFLPRFIPENIKLALFNRKVLAAVIVGFLYGTLKDKKIMSGIIIALTLGIIVAGLIYFWPLLVETAPILSQVPLIKEYAPKGIELVKEGPQKFIESQLPKNFVKPKIEEPPKRTVSARFINPLARDSTNIKVNVGVKLEKDLSENGLEVEFECQLDGKRIKSDPESIIVEQDGEEHFYTITCSSSSSGKQLKLITKASFEAESILPISIGEGKTKAAVISKMSHESPYSLVLELVESQPLKERDAPYPLYIKFFRDEKNTEVQKITSLELNVKSSYYNIACESPLNKLKFSADRSDLDKIVIDKYKDGFTFFCSLNVFDVPLEGVETGFINSKVKYIIEKEFKTTLLK